MTEESNEQIGRKMRGVSEVLQDIEDALWDNDFREFLTRTERGTFEWISDERRESLKKNLETGMRLVILESPCSGNQELNRRYANSAIRDCLARGESPYASHVMLAFSSVLNDSNLEERSEGMRAGFAWHRVAHASVVYTDLGISSGMEIGIAVAQKLGLEVQYRMLPGWTG